MHQGSVLASVGVASQVPPSRHARKSPTATSVMATHTLDQLQKVVDVVAKVARKLRHVA